MWNKRTASIAFATSLVLFLGALLALLTFRADRQSLAWRIDRLQAYLRGVVDPVGRLPTPLPQPTFTAEAELSPSPTPLTTAAPMEPAPLPALPSATPSPSPTSIPTSVSLSAPAYEKQDRNNCGPASLTMYLRYYGWSGTQSDISDLIKPSSADRNVNVEEMIYYVRNQAGWLNAEFRVGGDLNHLKQFLAAGIPVVIEEGIVLPETGWPGDDHWAAHYLLLTAYDDTTQTFIGQDSYLGADRKVPYEQLDDNWKVFNRVYILVYLPTQEGTVKSILGPDWDVEANRQRALETANAEAQANPQDAFAWFNIGSNLVYFERYLEAANAYDQARKLGLPQRMLRYQFGPFFAYFHTGRTNDLLTLTEYALKITPNSEEALLWRGWGLYRKGETVGAINQFREALKAHPNYKDAQYALSFLGAAP